MGINFYFLSLFMIVGAFIVNKSQIVSRFTEPFSVSKIEMLILDYIQNPNPLVIRGLYKYISYVFNEVSYVIITSLQFKELEAKKILKFLSNNCTLDPIDQIVTLDNILYDNNYLFPNLSLIKNMDSQEEKIYKMMMKNKAGEMKKKYNSLKKSTSSIKSMPCQSYISSKSVGLDIQGDDKKDINVSINNKPRSFETGKKDIFILLKEKMKCQVDVENNIKVLELNGEMTLNIKNEKYKNIQIDVKGDTSKCKFSPKLDKEAVKCNIIRSSKDFSLNKNIALMKWKFQDIKKLPISFTFWPSEIKPKTFQVSLEITAEEDLDNLLINIPTKNMLEKNTSEFLEWNVGNIKKDNSDSFDFQCKCNDIVNIFPIDVYFTSNKINLEIEEVKIKETEGDLEIRKVLEAEEFKLEYE